MSCLVQFRKLVAVLTGTQNGSFKEYLVTELRQRRCAVRFTEEAGELRSWLGNTDIVGIIVDDFNPAEVTGVRELLTVLQRARSEPIVLVLRPQIDLLDLHKFYDGSIWVHNPNEPLEECLDHVAFGKREERVYV